MNALLDSTLMDKYHFPSETLMELAGLAIAQVTNKILKDKPNADICVLVGPGNNGGDGLVAARHLKMMKYNVGLIMFKKLEGKNSIYHQLCFLNNIPSHDIQSFVHENI
jgi:NAD(P)H-hydrate epimerase